MVQRLSLPLLGLLTLFLCGTRAPLPSAPEPTVRSNVHAADYVGPAACGECHEEQHAAWLTHPHRTMNQNADGSTVVGDFSGIELDYAGGRARFDREGEAFFMTLWNAAGERRRYRVTRTVGTRFTQMYVGLQIEGPEPEDDPVYLREGKLAFGWWISRQGWFPEPYFDSDCPPEYAADGSLSLPPEDAHKTSWTTNCLYCHNTYPYVERAREGTGLTGFPASDLVLEPTAADDLEPSDLVTLGISCESCHFGGREHAEDGRSIRFLPSGPGLAFPAATPERIAGARDDPTVVNAICAQCHFSRGVSPYPNGAGTWNSREAVDLMGGACASQLKCTDCHDPHQAGPPGGGPDAPAHVRACVECHSAYADADARADHTQHGPEVSCLDCHMPRIVQGLEAVVRTHRIGSPTDARMLAAGAPNACNLCHLDRPLSWTLAALKLGWERDIQPEASWAKAYGGSLDAPVGHAWLSSAVPSHRLVAADAYARSPLGKDELVRLIRTLDDPIAVNRMFGLFALERVLGRQLSEDEYAPIASPERRREQIRALLQEHPGRG